jgi:hypothetical protein
MMTEEQVMALRDAAQEMNDNGFPTMKNEVKILNYILGISNA